VLRAALALAVATGVGLFAVAGAEPASPQLSGRFLLAVAACPGAATVCPGTSVQKLYQSKDGVRWSLVRGVKAEVGESPTTIRRGSRLYVFDGIQVSTGGITGSLRRFVVRGGSLTELAPSTFLIQLPPSSLEDAASATAISGSFARDASGALVAIYGLRLEPGTNACPIPGQSCLKLRTATEIPGSDGSLFAGDPGNRRVISFDPAEDAGSPSTYLQKKGYAVLVAGPGSCLQTFTASNLHGSYSPAPGLPGGCLASSVDVETPSGTYRAALHEHWLYLVSGGTVVRAVARRLTSRLPAARFRELKGFGSAPALSARFALNAP
jgi:hypothetical protein